MRRKLKKAGTAALLVLMGAAIFMYPNAAVAGASRGLSLCGTVIIPSLLPFLVLSGTFMRCSLCETAGRWLARPTAFLFRLPGVCAMPVLLSMVGGYPAGAAAVERLLEERQITVSQAARMMHFCVNAGPAFAVSAVGAAMLSDVRVGWLLLAAHLSAALLIGVTEARFAPRVQPQKIPSMSVEPLSAAFTHAVNGAALTLLYACGFVILFSVVLSLGDGSGLITRFDRLVFASPASPSLLSGLLEVSSGCAQVAGGAAPSVFLLGFFLGFGGLSVQCQVRSVLGAYPAALRYFFVFRLLHGVLGGGLSALLCRIVPLPLHTLAPQTAVLQPFAVSPLVSVVLLGMCACFLLSTEKKIVKRR